MTKAINLSKAVTWRLLPALSVSEKIKYLESKRTNRLTLANKKFNMIYLALFIASFFMILSLPAFAEYNRPSDDDVQMCIGIARVLELLAKEQGDAIATEKYRVAKNKFIQTAGVSRMETIGIVMGAMRLAADTRKKEGISAKKLRTRYETIFTERCE